MIAAARSGAPMPPMPGGVYLSDDAGAHWRKVNSETRLWTRGWYFEQITVDPKDPDTAYIANTGTFRTTDAGKTFTPIKSAPGGDDYHQLWINPTDGNRIALSSDQGTTISVDGGESWSTWYNQPTAQIYHIAASNDFPYVLVGAQQDSGAVEVTTWSPFGILSFRDWHPTCLAGESDTVVPDPTPGKGHILYGMGLRCDQALNLGIPSGDLPKPDPADPNRKTWSLPTVFSPADQALYYSNQFIFRTRDRGKSWSKISPDLTRTNPEVPRNLDPITAKDIDQPMTTHFGVVYTLSPSPLDAKTVWAGTDDGLIHLTTNDGATWKDVTPKPLTAWSKISQVEAGHFDAATAYASVDRHRLGDDKPYLYRTHDAGATWTLIARGIPTGAFVNCIREDPKQKGLLYAATEWRVYVSFDDGDHWQSLQNNMPYTSVRDLVVHGDDLAIATYGRGFWVVDHMEALRQLAANSKEITSARGPPLHSRRNLRPPYRRPGRHTPTPRRTHRTKPALRRPRLLLPEIRPQHPPEARTPRQLRRDQSLRSLRHPRPTARPRKTHRPDHLGRATRSARHHPRPPPHRPRHPASPLRRPPRQPTQTTRRRLPPHHHAPRPHRRQHRRHRTRPPRPRRPPTRHLYPPPHRRRPDLQPTRHCQNLIPAACPKAPPPCPTTSRQTLLKTAKWSHPGGRFSSCNRWVSSSLLEGLVKLEWNTEPHSSLEVFLVFLRLGCISFGGPIAHLSYFHKELIERRHWCSEETEAELIALAQSLPGPSSSQVGFALGLVRAGWKGGLAAWLGFTLPSAVLMIALALGSKDFTGPLALRLIHGLQVVAVAVVAQAIRTMQKALAPDRLRLTLAIAATLLVLLLPTHFAALLTILFGALVGLLLPIPLTPQLNQPEALGLNARTGVLCGAVFLVLLLTLAVLSHTTRSHTAQVAWAFFRSGALVFGGGHVVLPVLESAVVAPGWVRQDTFLAGFGAAQALPGPLFTFAGFLGASLTDSPSPSLSGVLALLAIFIPGLLLMSAVMPFWARWRSYSPIQKALRGTNAAVVGILIASLYTPLATTAIHSRWDFGCALVAFTLLVVWNTRPWVLVLAVSLAYVLAGPA